MSLFTLGLFSLSSGLLSGQATDPVTNVTQSTSYTTIQSAIDAANTGDVIQVAAGTYNEFVDVDKALTIRGANFGVDPNTGTRSAESIIDYNGDYAVEIFASNVTFDGFSVSNEGGNAVRISVGRQNPGSTANVDNVTVRNNIATGNAIESCPSCTGLYMGVLSFDNFEDVQYTSSDIAFMNNRLSVSATNGRGITMSAYNGSQLTGDITISDNHILTSGTHTSIAGIELRGSSGITSMQDVAISGNTISGGFDIAGVWPRGSSTANISGNLFTGNLIDIRLDHDPDNNENVIENNSLSGSTTAVSNNTVAVVDATCNWWGQDSGPAAGQVSGDVTFSPWKLSGDLEADDCAPVLVYSDSAETNLVSGHTTIQSAINAATTVNGYVVRVAAGTYNEFVDVSKELSIRGANYGVDPNTGTRSAESIIDYNGDYAVEIFASNVTFDGFSVSNEGGNAVRISVGRNTSGTVNDVSVSNNIATGKAILSCPTCTGLYMGVLSFDNFENALYTSSNIAFMNNRLSVSETNGRGITMSAYNNSQLTGAITISGNHILTSGTHTSIAGIELRGSSGITSMQDVAISGNTISGFDIAGVWPRGSSTANISENFFVANTTGILLDHDPDNNNNVIVNNSFSGSTTAVSNSTGAVVNATCNWFGQDSGPAASQVSGDVTFSPWKLSGDLEADDCSGSAGCTNSGACNYDSDATADDGLCTFDCYGCLDTDGSAIIDDNSCALCDETQDFNGEITLGATQTPEEGAWYVDRYAPAGFISNASFDGGQRLRHIISEFDGAQYRGAQSGAFYDTQGRKYDLPENTKSLEIELYIPAAWETTNRRMAGLWGTALDAANEISAYPIVEFASDNEDPRFQVWTASGWTSIGLPDGFEYDNWYTLSINLLENGEFLYRAGDLAFVSDNYASNASTSIDNVILQGHNTETGVNYVIHWDNLTYGSTCSEFEGLTYELVQENGVPGYTTYRVYANFAYATDTLTAVYGVVDNNEQSPLTIRTSGEFYQDTLGGLTAAQVNPNIFALAPNLVFDSYLALGEEPQATALQVTGIALDAFTDSLIVDSEDGGLWYVLPGLAPEAGAGEDGKVLIGQFTTDGIVDMTVNLQYRASNGANLKARQASISFPESIPGCTDETACNYNPLATVNNDSCLATGCAYYVNDDATAGDVYTNGIGDDSFPGTQAFPFRTIQHAIDVATAGDTIFVDAGIYAEQLELTKALALVGPNQNLAGYDESRNAEAVLRLPNPESFTSGTHYLVRIPDGVAGASLIGFTLEDNLTGELVYDGSFPLPIALGGVISFESTTLVENNRLLGFNNTAIRMTQLNALSGQTTLAKVNNTTRFNYIEGGAVYHAIYYQASSGSIESNRIVNAAAGIQIQPYRANASGLVSQNEISSYGSGLYYNYANWTIDDEALWTFSSNSVSAPETSPVWSSLVWNASPRAFEGIRVETYLQDTGTNEPKASFVGNTVDGQNAMEDEQYLDVRGMYFRNINGDTETNVTNLLFSNNAVSNVNVGVQFDEGTTVSYSLTELFVNGNTYPVNMAVKEPYQINYILGCTNPSACNYIALATIDDNDNLCDYSCIVCADGVEAGTNATYAPGFCNGCDELENFNAPIAIASTQTPGSWYTDRYAPSVFAGGVNFLSGQRLRHIISEFDGGQYRGAQSGAFYDTQGRKFDLPDNTRQISIDLYVPAAWETSDRRMAGLWGTAYNSSDAIAGYPIIEYASVNDQDGFRTWDGDGSWTHLGLPDDFAYNSWVNLTITLLDNGQFLYQVSNASGNPGTLYHATSAMNSEAETIGNVILQGHNTEDGVSYVIHWDDFEYSHGLLGCTDITACNYNPNASCDDNTCDASLATTEVDVEGPEFSLFTGFPTANDHMVVVEDCNVSAAITALERNVGEIDPDGTNVYRIETGQSPQGSSSIDPTGTARWNYAINVDLDDYTFNDVNVILDIDFDPAVAVDDRFAFNYSEFMITNSLGATSILEASQNPGFDFWPTLYPAAANFDPDANGQYDLTLRIESLDGELLVSASIVIEAFTPGCINTGACNYNADATDDDGSCEFISCADCAGVPNGNASLDNCNVCSGGTTGITPNSTCLDCAGVVNGAAEVDDCNVCSGGTTGITPNSSCTDCAGVLNGTAEVDDCNVCSGGNTGITPNSSCTDCAGVLNGTAEVDDCNVCSGGTTGITPNSTCLDCAGVVNGTAVIDDCGVCSGGTTGETPCVTCLGDFNQDGAINASDLLILIADWDCNGPNCIGDLNNDGLVNSADLGIFIGLFGTVCQ